jgi:hypothetical protein
MTHSKPKRKYRRNSDRVIRVHGLRHDPPEPKRLAKALLALAAELATAQAEADAKAAHQKHERAEDDGEAAS